MSFVGPGELHLRRSLVLLSTIALISSTAWVATRAAVGAAQLSGQGVPTVSNPSATTAPSPTPSVGPCPVKAVALYVTPDPARAGDAVAAYGRVQWTGAPKKRCGLTVVLWQRTGSERRFSQAFSTTTGAAGRYRFSLPAGTVQTNSEWFVTARRVHSPTVEQHVHAVITLTSTATFAVAGDRETFSGGVNPGHVGQRVWLQRRAGKTWRTLATPRVSVDSGFSAPRVLVNPGSQQWRAMVPADQSNIGSHSDTVSVTVAPASGIHKIRHVVIIMQENRSFDSYFGTYPGADGLPAGVCEPDPVNSSCVAPFHDSADVNSGGPHGASNATADIDGGLMDGFVGQAQQGMGCSTTDPTCSPCTEQTHAAGQQPSCVDVMGYHDAREIPNYWAYAANYVLQDHMFAPVASWSLPAHLYEVSEWSATCASPMQPFSCHADINYPTPDWTSGTVAAINAPSDQTAHYAWTDMTYLLRKQNVSWGYYVLQGSEPDCENASAMVCTPIQQTATTPGIWNPLPDFTDVGQDGQLSDIQPQSSFYAALQNGTMPSVSWLIPNGTVSEHPPATVSAGQAYVTNLINSIMESPEWGSTAIFVSWDDWGGFYDHVVPPVVDSQGYGLRVPGLVISPYAKEGFVDHQILSQDAYNKFIEADFLGGQRLDPATDGRPDPRPDVRENAPVLGDLAKDFNFAQAPRRPLILPLYAAPGPASTPP